MSEHNHFPYGYTWTRQAPGNSTENPTGTMYPTEDIIPEMQPLAGVSEAELHLAGLDLGGLDGELLARAEAALAKIKKYRIDGKSFRIDPPAFGNQASAARYVVGLLYTLLAQAKTLGDTSAATALLSAWDGIFTIAKKYGDENTSSPFLRADVTKIVRPGRLLDVLPALSGKTKDQMTSVTRNVINQYIKKNWQVDAGEKQRWLTFFDYTGGRPAATGPTASGSSPPRGLYTDDQGTIFRWDPSAPSITLTDATGTSQRKVWTPRDAAYAQVKANLFATVRPFPGSSMPAPSYAPAPSASSYAPDTSLPAPISSAPALPTSTPDDKRMTYIKYGGLGVLFLLGMGAIYWATQPGEKKDQ
jgi:hypothetical protein